MKILSLLAIMAFLGISGCGKSPEVDRVSLAQKEVDCETRRASVVQHVVRTLEIQYADKSNFSGDTPKLSDEEFKVRMQEVIIPAWLEDKADKKNTQIALELWKSKQLFEKIAAKEVGYKSMPGTRKDNTEQEEAIWKVGKAICLSS